jgi:hypothetical protein
MMLGALEADISVDPTGTAPATQAISLPGATITGSPAPLIPREWWPWIIVVGIAGVAYYLTRQKGGGRDKRPPFDG